MPKTLVLYVFHIVNNRVKHFIKHALFSDPSVDFLFISNDPKAILELPPYVKCIYRENIGFDFGGWSDALLKENLYRNYDSFIFVNSSVIGPFTPSYFKGKWTDIYLEPLNESMRLFGSTINSMRKPTENSHVQSYIFSMERETLEYLIQEGIFTTSSYAKTLYEAVLYKEIRMSRLICAKGWNIGSLLPYYNGVDFTFRSKSPAEYGIPFLDDVMYPRYRGELWNEHQLVFIKGNRVEV